MSDDGTIKSTPEARERLEIEYKIFNRFLFEKTSNCLAYKTDFLRSSDSEPSVCPQWQHFHKAINSRDSLGYRVGALIWHCRQFPDHHKFHTEKISELIVRGQEHFNESMHASNIASFLFDDVIFCAVSVFDYLSQLIFRHNYPTRKGRKLWSDLVKIKDHEDEKLGEMIQSVNGSFVKGLSRLRGRSIHEEANVGHLECNEFFDEGGITHSFNFAMPDEAMKLVSIFSASHKSFSIEPGAYLIALHTIFSVRNILDQLGSYEYECVYNPHKT